MFDWSGSDNVAEVAVEWPRPAFFESFGITTVGYEGAVVLPLIVDAPCGRCAVQLEGRITLGVCREMCVFEETEVSAAIPPEVVSGAAAVEAALAEVPAAGALQGLEAVACRLTGAGAERQFAAELVFDRTLEDAVVLLEGPESAWFYGTETRADGPVLAVEAEVSLTGGWLARDAIRMTVLAEDFAADVQGCGPS